MQQNHAAKLNVTQGVSCVTSNKYISKYYLQSCYGPLLSWSTESSVLKTSEKHNLLYILVHLSTALQDCVRTV